MTHTKSRGVLIGAGYFAQFHAEAWTRIPAAEIVAVADPVPGRAAAFAAKYGIGRAGELVEELLDRERPDFVDIVTRPDTHRDLVRTAARRGIHVLCQKPMAPTMDDCRAMVDDCAAAGVRLLIHENWRWQPWYREVRRLLDDGALGRVFQFAFRWRTGDGRGPEPYATQPYFRAMPRLLVYETLVHVLDTFRFLGGEFTDVACRNRRVNPAIAGEDHSLILVSFESGALGIVDANRMTGPVPAPVAMGSLKVEGDLAALRMSPDGRLWRTGFGEPERPHEFPVPTGGYKGDSVWATQRHLIDCLRSGERSESEGRDYLKTVAAVFACYQSAETGRMVALG